MADKVSVRESGELRCLGDALVRFAAELGPIKSAMAAELAGVTAWVDDRVRFWQRAVQGAEQQLREAHYRLLQCQNRGADCYTESHELSQAQRKLDEATANLQLALRWQHKLGGALEEHRRIAAQLEWLASHHTPRSRDYLERVELDLQRYEEGRLAAAGGLTADLPVLEPLAQMLTGILPGEEVADLAATSGEWVDKGIQLVSVETLPFPEDIDEGEFKKVSLDEMTTGLARLQEMLPVMAGGEGLTSDYWAALDRATGLDPTNGYQRVYEVFFGARAIRVEWTGSRFDIVGGRHRIWLAHRMGLTTIPVHLIVRAGA